MIFYQLTFTKAKNVIIFSDQYLIKISIDPIIMPCEMYSTNKYYVRMTLKKTHTKKYALMYT